VGYQRYNADDQEMTTFPLVGSAIVNVPHPIASGPDDAVWFLEDADKVTRLSMAGEVSRPYRIPGVLDAAIAQGADEALWVVTGQTLWRLEP
jgi:streptogramin lyase